MATLLSADTRKLVDFLVTESHGQRSRDNAVVKQTGAAIKSGTVLTIITTTGADQGKYIPYTAAGAAGNAKGILYKSLAAATGDAKVVVFNMDCEVYRDALTGLDAAAVTDLLGLGIKVRGRTGLLTQATPTLS